MLDGRQAALNSRILLSSGISLLLAAASRLPSWEVSSPVSWLIGTVNVGFLPIFGQIFVLGAFCFTYLALREYLALRTAIQAGTSAGCKNEDPVLHAMDSSSIDPADRLLRTVTFVQKMWAFGIPVLAYVILLVSYFDFVRPKIEGCIDTGKPECFEWRYPSRAGQVADLLLGNGGRTGFRPLTPAIQAALRDRGKAAQDEKKFSEGDRLLRLASTIPWIYPPWQTWAYIAGLALQIWISARGWREYKGVPKTRTRH